MACLIRTSASGAVLLVCACTANQLAVTYNCDPTGASLYDGDRSLGNCPTTLNYDVTQDNREQGFVLLRGITARWVSGAYSSVPSIRADLENGYNQQITFTRPRDVPGYEVDASFALQYEQNEILRRQAQAQQNQAYWSMMNALQQQQLLNQQTYQSNQGRTCTSREVSDIVETQCY